MTRLQVAIWENLTRMFEEGRKQGHIYVDPATGERIWDVPTFEACLSVRDHVEVELPNGDKQQIWRG
jgi:hypothetical protein